MKKLLLIVSVLFALGSHSQVVNVNTTTYTIPQLVTDVLFGSGVGGGSCAGTISNITWSTGTNFGGPAGISYFTNTNPNFPLNAGVVLVSGSVVDVPGPNDTTQSNGTWPGDNQLFNYIDGLGIDPGLNSYNNASILEFDFVPLTNQMSFDFMFASEEYGTYQCTFSDAFAFFLTDVTAGTPFTNLALIPNTTTPVSVVTIRNTLYNGGCPSVNPAFFDKYYLLPEGLNPNIAPINFNGHTVKMTASSTVVPNHTYHIKLVVADRNDSALDSAVFLGAGSFNIGQANVSGAAGTGFEALTDFTIANGAALCNQSCRDIRAGNAPIPGVSYQWTLNGFNIPGATNYTYTVCAPGTYGIVITFPSGCQQLDDMIIEYLPAMPLSNPVDLYSATTQFNLNLNTPNILGGQNPTDFNINYHNSLIDAQNVANMIPNPSNYTGFDGEVIYVSIQDDASGSDCKETRSFVLHITNPLAPPDLVTCDDASNDGSEIFDLTVQTPIVLGTNNPADYTITYHISQADADNDVNVIPNPNAYPSLAPSPQIIYVRMEDNVNPASYSVVTFQLIVNVHPVAGVDGSTTVCEDDTTPINLFSLITGEQPGGVWTQTSGTGGVFNAVAGTYTPAVGATTSTFTYTVTGVAPCTTDTSLATVNINPQPTAGVDGSTTVCEDDTTPINLFSLITGEQPGGVWTQTSGTGGVFNAVAGTYTPAVGATTSTFTYTVTGVAPCTTDTSLATVNINPQPTAGVDGSTTVCETSTTVINLFSLITGEQPGGVWTQTSGTGGAFNAVAGTYTPAVGATTSTFTYTVTGVAPCINDTSLATVNINPQPTAGVDGSTTVCENDTTVINLFSLITGEQPGGVWTQTSGTGGAFNAVAATYTPAVGATTSTFTYTVTGVAPCINDTSLATVNINPQPTAGVDGSTTVCETSTTAINLFSLITGEQPGGVWTQTSGTGGVFNAVAGTYTPAVGATTSTFTYTVTGVAPCINDTSLATVNINPQPTAGVDGSITVCETSTATIDLYNLITGEQPGGVWTQTSGTGGTFDPITGTFIPAVGATTSTFTYTVTGVAPCINDTSLATVNINPQPTAGADGSIAVCENDTTAINLFSLITGEQPGGVWTQTSGTGGVFNAVAGTYTPAVGATSSTFTYTLIGTAPCINDASLATITINPVPTATIAASSPSVCMNYPSPTVTFTGFSGTSPYTFTYTINAGIPNTTPQSSPTHVINVPTNTVGPFTYELVSVTDANGCTQAINQSVTVTVLTAPIINTPIAYELCDDDSNDGIACFDLTGVVAPQVTTNPTLIVTFHETLTDSQTGAYPQVSPYCNINNLNNQTLYIRVFDPNAPQCYALTTVQLIVHPKPIAVEPTPLHECDDNYDGFTVFNLTDKTAEILGSINPVTHSIHYYESLADAQVPQNAIGLPTSYTNIVANTQTIWVRVETLSTGCFDIVELQLVVDPLPLVNQPACTAYTVCETAAPIGFEQFNLQTKVDCILQGQLGMSVTFYPSLLNAQNNTNVISNLLYTNIVAYVQTLGIRVTNMTTGCYVISTMDIRVEPLPVPIAPLSAYEVCDTDQNGIYEFDLTTLSAGILGANPSGNVISYHETQTDAQMGTNAISLTQPYLNIIPYMQTLWVNVTNPATGCYGIIPIQIKVNESPRMPDLNDLVYCDEDSNNQNGITSINLAQQTPLILAAQTILPISNYTVTYYTSLLDAQQQVNNIINTTTFTGTNQTIWVVVEHNITGCTKIGEFDIIVNIPLALTPPPALSVCDDDSQPNNTYTTFDLTIREAVITQGLPGYTVTYYPSYANALAHTNAILNPTAYINTQAAVQTLGIMVTSPAGCRSYTTMDIRVLPVPTPNRTNIPILAPQCEDAVGSGQQFFNLTVNQTYILNNDPNVTAHYFHTLADATAVPPVNEILNPANAYIGDSSIAGQVPRPVNYVQNIYIAVTSNLFTEYTGQNCYVIVEQPFIINPLPIVKVIGEQQICEEDPLGNDGIEVFDLTSYNSDLLSLNNTTPASSYTVNFYTDLGYTNLITNPTSYSNVTNPQTIYVSITATDTYVDPVTGISHTTSCTSRDKFDIRVNPKPTITQPANPLATCDVNDSQNDGYDENYDLSSLVTEILNGQDPTQFTVTFYDSEYNPDATPPLVPTPLNVASYDVYTHTYWAAVTNNATGCFKTTSFNIVVEETPEPFIKNDPQLNVICVDYNTHQVVRPLLLETENLAIPYLVNQPNYTYEWFEDGVAIANSNSSTLLIDFALNDNTSSIFTVVMTSDTALGCSDVSQNYLVIQSGQATPITGTIGYTVTNAFTDNQIITVTVDGYGTYQYSLDDGPRQDSPVFEYVSLGEHIITVWDTEGGIENSCDPLIIENVQTIDYPLYFTPNGDGVHETWNIVGLGGQPDAKIYIFDRHGKLIKQISSTGAGWDGTYNGQQMPSTDYWFTVDYREQETVKQFKAHFSLKR